MALPRAPQLSVALALFLSTSLTGQISEGSIRVHVIDVGQAMATLVESGSVRSPGRSTGGEGRGAVEFRAQGRDGIVLGLGGHGRQLHGEGASGRAGTQAGVGLEQRLGKGADFLGLAGMRCEHGDGKGFGPVSIQVKCAAARFEEDFLIGGAGPVAGSEGPAGAAVPACAGNGIRLRMESHSF